MLNTQILQNMNILANTSLCYKNRNSLLTELFFQFCHFFCVCISPLEEPCITRKKMKTESVSEDVETENTNDNEETLGKGKDILKGKVQMVTKLCYERPCAEYDAFAASH